MNHQESRTLTFKVQSFRRIPNPYLKSEEGEKGAEMYVAICDVKDLPDNFPMETNPREQKMTTNVARKIKDSLLNTSELNFYLLNRGILLSAKDVSYSNYSNEMTVSFEWILKFMGTWMVVIHIRRSYSTATSLMQDSSMLKLKSFLASKAFFKVWLLPKHFCSGAG